MVFIVDNTLTAAERSSLVRSINETTIDSIWVGRRIRYADRLSISEYHSRSRV